MDNRVTHYAPCTCMATLNFHFNRFPAAGELTTLDRAVREWLKNKQTQFPDMRLHDLLLNWRNEEPVFQVFYAYQYKSDALFDELIEMVDKNAVSFSPTFTLKEVRINLSPVEY